MIAIFSRYGHIQEDEAASLTAAKHLLWAIEEAGTGFGIGIIDKKTGVLYIDESVKIITRTDEELREEKRREVEKIGYEVKQVVFYK
jgi:hypothetical protein